tara:strand:- start:3233 stop:4084 length:852 start_codon:yes stop_codon:yes gene_type:complete
MTKKTKTLTSQMFVEDDELEVVEKEAEVPAEVEPVVVPGNVNIVEFPSKGLLGYPSLMEYREMMVADEEILASATESTYSRTLNGVLKSVMNDCPFFEKLTVVDRDWALIWIWANNYTDVKTVTVECNSCSNKEDHKVYLSKLPYTDIRENISKHNPTKIPLAKTGGHVEVRLNTVADEMFAEEYTARHKDVKWDFVMLCRSIGLGRDIPFDVKMKWVRENVSAKEMSMIRKYHSHFAYGINPTIEHKCSACGEVTHGLVPFQATDVLFPDVSDDFADELFGD